MNDLFSQHIIIERDAASIVAKAKELFSELDNMQIPSKVHAINSIRAELHKYSPFKTEPVDCVQWISADIVGANDYNPNSVAPPEMKLLEHSITEDGYTQPIVAWKNGEVFEVVDGFHRHRVGRESKTVKSRVYGYLPLAIINDTRLDRSDRIAATIRHNRARGKHKVEAMSDIVIELKRRNWSDERIGKELGMDADEVLRLCQITGLAEVFADQEFSKSWDIDEAIAGTIADEIISDAPIDGVKVNPDRVFHTWDKWECFEHGFYEEKPEGMTQDEGEEKYRAFLSDSAQFETALIEVTEKWIHSCEHYLTNERMNRIAWLGQASVAQALRIPSCCRGGYNRLTDSQKEIADSLALKYLNIWLTKRGKPEVVREQALSRTENELY